MKCDEGEAGSEMNVGSGLELHVDQSCNIVTLSVAGSEIELP